MTTTQRAVLVAALLLLVAAAGFLFLRRGSDTPFAFPTTTATTTTGADTTATTVADPTGTVTEPDEAATTTSTVTATTTPTGAEPDAPAITTTTAVPAVTVPIPAEPDEWWAYNADLEWPVTDRDRLATGAVYPSVLIEDAVQVAHQVQAFWSWYMTWGHPQGPALDLSDDPRLAGDAVGQLMYLHHRFWQERLPVWRDVWNREFEQARFQQRNKLIYLDSLGALSKEIGVSGGSLRPSSLLYNPGGRDVGVAVLGTDRPSCPGRDSTTQVRGTDTPRRHPRGLRTPLPLRRPPSALGLGLCASGTSRRNSAAGLGSVVVLRHSPRARCLVCEHPHPARCGSCRPDDRGAVRPARPATEHTLPTQPLAVSLQLTLEGQNSGSLPNREGRLRWGSLSFSRDRAGT